MRRLHLGVLKLNDENCLVINQTCLTLNLKIIDGALNRQK